MYITKQNCCYHNAACGQFNKKINTSVINAINTIDSKTNEYDTKVDNYYNVYSCIPLMATMIPLYGISAVFFSNNLKNSQKMKYMTPIAIISALSYSIFTKKRAAALFNGHIAGQQNVLQNELNNPKLFATLDEEQQNIILKNNLYQYYSNKKYTNDFNLFPNYNLHQTNKFIKDINREAKNLKFTYPKETDINKTIEEIDRNTWNYTNKVIKGINLMLAGCCGFTMLAIHQYNKHTKNIKPQKFSLILSTVLALIPMSILSKIASSSFFDNLNKISRHKAKQNFILNKNTSANPLAIAFDYIINKSKYKKEAQRQDKLTKVKNSIITKMDFTTEKIEEAKKIQKDFFEATNSSKRINMLKENKLKNEILRDGTANGMLLPLLLLPLLNIIELFSKTANKDKYNKNLIAINTLTLATCLINTLIASKINTKNKVA